MAKEVSREHYISILQKQLFQAIKTRCPWANEVSVQMDSAGGHGGRGEGIQKTLKTLNDWGINQNPA